MLIRLSIFKEPGYCGDEIQKARNGSREAATAVIF
jgi:hypothetical protein